MAPRRPRQFFKKQPQESEDDWGVESPPITYLLEMEWNGAPKKNPMIHVTNGISSYIYHKNQPNVGEYTIHGSYG